MLRTTIAITAAGLGGADAITVLPFTIALGLPDRVRAPRRAQSRNWSCWKNRISAQVADPAAGSGGIEALTDAAGAMRPGRCFRRSRRPAARRRRSSKRLDPEEGRRDARGARGSDRPPQGCADRHQRLSQSCRSAASRCSTYRASTVPPFDAGGHVRRRCRRCGSPSRSRPCATSPMRRSPKTGARPKVFLATLGKLADFTRARDVRQELLRGRRHRGGRQ